MAAPVTSKTLLARVRAGDTLGWEEFYHTYKHLVIAVVRSVTGAQGFQLADDEIADVVQEVMFALVKPGKFTFDPAKEGRNGKVRFSAWFSGVVRNKLLGLLRSKARRSLLETASNDAPESGVKDGASFERVWDKEWHNHLIGEALSEMKSNVEEASYRAFEMSTLDELPPEEVAAALGMTVKNVYVCKSRCLKKLRRILISLQKQA